MYEKESTYHNKLTNDKKKMNNMYAKKAASFPTKKHCFIEAENRYTINRLMREGIKVNLMTAINGSEDVCKKIKSGARTKKIDVIQAITTTFYKKTSEKFATFWNDYMCTITGNKWCRPIEDASIILQRELIEDGGYIINTFSYRQKKFRGKNRPIPSAK